MLDELMRRILVPAEQCDELVPGRLFPRLSVCLNPTPRGAAPTPLGTAPPETPLSLLGRAERRVNGVLCGRVWRVTRALRAGAPSAATASPPKCRTTTAVCCDRIAPSATVCCDHTAVRGSFRALFKNGQKTVATFLMRSRRQTPRREPRTAP